jgi:hypothetical protein
VYHDIAFWEKVVKDPRFRPIVLQGTSPPSPGEVDAGGRVALKTSMEMLMRPYTELRKIMYRPALTQSIKGLFTAGFSKSVRYSWAKIRKWWKARQSTRSRV